LQQSIKQAAERFRLTASAEWAPYRLAEALAELCFCEVESDHIAFDGQAGLFARVLHPERTIRVVVTSGRILVQLEPRFSTGIAHIGRPFGGAIKPWRLTHKASALGSAMADDAAPMRRTEQVPWRRMFRMVFFLSEISLCAALCPRSKSDPPYTFQSRTADRPGYRGNGKASAST
jgi:hypothetical protein